MKLFLAHQLAKLNFHIARAIHWVIQDVTIEEFNELNRKNSNYIRSYKKFAPLKALQDEARKREARKYS